MLVRIFSYPSTPLGATGWSLARENPSGQAENGR